MGRTDEVAVLDALLSDPVCEPRALLIEGEAGIGKTALLRELLAMARQRDVPVLTCRPARSETDLSYASLVELLESVDGPILAGLPAPQARVLRMVLRREEPDGVLDRLSLGVATTAVIRALAMSGPVLIAIDDAQWLDHPSANALAFVIRRLDGAAARLAVVQNLSVVRAAEREDAVKWPSELSRAMPERLDTIRVGPLGPSELSRILRRTLGWAPAWPRVLRIAELSDGNPLYALELTRAIGARPDGDVDGLLPDSAAELARSRIAKLPERVRDAVELVAVPHAPTLDLLRRLDSAALDLREALTTAERAGIVVIDGDRVRFCHPILAAAAYGSIPTMRKRELHRAVAMLSDDLEECARHLAAAAEGPDPQVAVILERAAEGAWRRGAPDAAADLLRLACRLTPTADADALALRRIAYGRLLHSAGDIPGSIAELTAITDDLPPGLVRARGLYHLAYVTRLSGTLGRAVERGMQAAVEAAADPSLQAEVWELLSRISDDAVARKLEAARNAMVALGRISLPDPDTVFYARAALVEAEFYAGLGIHLERLDGLDPGTRPQFPPVRTALGGDDLIGRLLTFAGRIDEGLAMLRGLYERASVGARSILPSVLTWMAEAQIMAGRFAAAAESTREAIERAEESGTNGGNPFEVGWHAVALARLGRLDEAEETARRVVEAAESDPAISIDGCPARLALGITALSRGQFNAAGVHLKALDRIKQEAGIRDPRFLAHDSDLIEALVGAGEVAQAQKAVARLEGEAATSQGQWSSATAARGRALVLGAHGQLDEAMEAAQHSLALFEGLPMPFERARTVFALGQLRRRRREKRLALAVLGEALQTFEELQTPIWVERARAEMARIPRQRTGDRLTATEERIAALVADGLTNREIADRMFVSPKTVEVNLTRIYRKLGVRSRAQLARQLAGEGTLGGVAPQA